MEIFPFTYSLPKWPQGPHWAKLEVGAQDSARDSHVGPRSWLTICCFSMRSNGTQYWKQSSQCPNQTSTVM